MATKILNVTTNGPIDPIEPQECEDIVKLPRASNLKTLAPLPSHDVAHPTDDRTKTMGDLLYASHETVAPLRDPEMLLHSHMPHILGSGFYLGASSAYLREAYETVLKTLKRIDPSFKRGETIRGDRLQDYIGNKEFTMAFVDFFDEEFRRENGDWKTVVNRYLFTEKGPFMNGLFGGLGHPIIHLAYAHEYESSRIASEGMSLLCTDYFQAADLLENPPPDTSTYKSEALGTVLKRIRKDGRFDGIADGPGIQNSGAIMQKSRTELLEHWHAWEVVDPVCQLEQICDLATVVAMSTADRRQPYDFFLIHLLTVAHALRFLWNQIPQDKQKGMLRAYGMMMIMIYICQERPEFDLERITRYDLGGRDWKWVEETAVQHDAKFDVHFFKVVRAPKVLSETYGEKDGFYLKASIKFLDEFTGFEGFGKAIKEGFDPRLEGWQAPEKGLS